MSKTASKKKGQQPEDAGAWLPRVNVLRRVEVAMQGDTESPRKQSAILIEAYRAASPEARAVVDEVFVCLCGWSLRTILRGEDHNEDDHDDDVEPTLWDDEEED